MSERITEIEARLNAATSGPWKSENCGASCCVWVTSAEKPEGQLAGVDGISNAELIANAPADIAYLLAELRKK